MKFTMIMGMICMVIAIPLIYIDIRHAIYIMCLAIYWLGLSIKEDIRNGR